MGFYFQVLIVKLVIKRDFDKLYLEWGKGTYFKQNLSSCS